MSSRKVSLALVGCGGIAGAHLKAYKDLHDRGVRQFEVTACCDISVESARARADQIAQFQGKAPVVFARVEELVKAGAAEAADVCVPHCYHHSATLPFLEGGMHVLLEKPLGITVKASRMLIAAAERKGRILATAENIRRGLSARACRWALSEEQMIGEVPAADVQMVYNGQLNFADPKFKWRGVKLLTGGGQIDATVEGQLAHIVEVLVGRSAPAEAAPCDQVSGGYESHPAGDAEPSSPVPAQDLASQAS